MLSRMVRLPVLDRGTAWTLAFWLFTYGVLSVRGRLLPTGPLDWLSAKRLFAISVGGLIFWLALRAQDRLAEESRTARVAIALVASILGSGVLLVARVGVQGSVDFDTASIADELRWLLLWNGYFIGWLGFYVVASQPRPARTPGTAPIDPGPEPEFWVHSHQRRVRVAAAAIERISAEGNYARIHAGADSGLVRMSLAQISAQLDPARYVRLHRSAICRRDVIAAVARQRSGAFIATLTDGTEVPVGRRLGATLLDEVRQRRGT